MDKPEEVVQWILKNRKEDRRIEIKRSIELINVQKDEMEKDSVAVANSSLPDPFGWIIFGIDKSYDVIGTVDLEAKKHLSDDVIEKRRQQYSQIASRTSPPLSYDWNQFQYLDKKLIAVKIESRKLGHWHQTSKGGIFYRLDGHTYLADERIIRKWIEERPESRRENAEPEKSESDINHLLDKLHSGRVPLSQCFVEALKIALSIGDHELETFCKHELSGWSQEELVRFRKESASHRDLEAFLSVDQVNPRYIGWRSGQDIMDFMMRNRDKFTLTKLAMSHPISEIESFLPSDRDRDDLATMRIPLADIVSRSRIPGFVDTNRSFVFAYMTTSSIRHLLESIRVELSRRLLELVQ